MEKEGKEEIYLWDVGGRMIRIRRNALPANKYLAVSPTGLFPTKGLYCAGSRDTAFISELSGIAVADQDIFRASVLR